MHLLTEGARNLGFALTERQVEQFQLYYETLVEWNSRVNLTAITEYDRTNPDIVLMDLRMPRMDGLTCLDRLRKQYPKVRVVILSATHDQEHILTALKRGASGFILKTVGPADLPEGRRPRNEGTGYHASRHPPPPPHDPGPARAPLPWGGVLGPRPAVPPLVAAVVVALRPLDGLEPAHRGLGEGHHLGQGLGLDLLQGPDVLVGRHHQVPVRIGVKVEDHEAALAAMDDQVRLVLIRGRFGAEEALVLGARGSVFHEGKPRRRPEAVVRHSDILKSGGSKDSAGDGRRRVLRTD